MNAATATNGASHHVPEGWGTAADLQAKFGGSVRTIHRWGESGRIGRVKDVQNRAWFDPEDYQRKLRAEQSLEPEEAEKLEVRKSEVLTHGSNDLLRQLMRHNEQMFGPASDAHREVLALFKAENQSLREQVKELTRVHLENMQAREALLSEAHVRDLELRQFQAAEDRKKAALDMVKGPAKQLLSRITGGAVVNDTLPAPSSKLAPARALLASLTDDQLSMLVSVDTVRETLTALLDTEVLSDEQKGFVREVLV